MGGMDSALYPHRQRPRIGFAAAQVDHAPDAATFEVPRGWNRVRVSRCNLARATQADVDSDKSPETTEKIRIQVWAAPERPARIIKRWS